MMVAIVLGSCADLVKNESPVPSVTYSPLPNAPINTPCPVRSGSGCPNSWDSLIVLEHPHYRVRYTAGCELPHPLPARAGKYML